MVEEQALRGPWLRLPSTTEESKDDEHGRIDRTSEESTRY